MSQRCELCHAIVRMKLIQGIECMGKLWHKKCFQCSVCCLRLDLKSYHTQDGQLYCLTHAAHQHQYETLKDVTNSADVHTYMSCPASVPSLVTTQPPVRPPNGAVINEPWFHGALTREQAQSRLTDDGDFLLRLSQEKPGDYVVTVKWKGKPYHFVCPKTPQGNWNFSGKEIKTLAEWVKLHINTKTPVCVKSGAILKRAVDKPGLERANETIPWTDLNNTYLLPCNVPAAATQQEAAAAAAAPEAAATATATGKPVAKPRQNSVPTTAKSFEEAVERTGASVSAVSRVAPVAPVGTPAIRSASDKRTSFASRPSTQMTFDDIAIDTGNISEQKVDVIVNSAGSHLNLSQGALSKSLLAVAGDELQNELISVAPQYYAQPGDVYVTKGYKLPCKNVIHAICYKFKDGEKSTVQSYRDMIQRILTEAGKLKAKSIAIPPIGTGNLGYPAGIVAKVMTEEVSSFMEAHPDSSLTEFRFVMLPSDTNLIQAFHKVLQVTVCDDQTQDIDQEMQDVIKEREQDAKKSEQGIQKLGLKLPLSWSLAETDQSPYHKTELKRQTKEYSAVLKNMADRDGESFIPYIFKIERVECRQQYLMYEMSKYTMECQVTPGTTVERVLWHGTDGSALEGICQFGFNRAYCGKNGTLWGKGVYCAHDFSYSARDAYSPPDPQGIKYVIQCRVLTGEHTLGNPEMIAPPERKPGILYDTAVDDLDDPRIFVVFYDYRMYPEYIISFFG